MNSSPRPPNPIEFAGLAACLIQDRHPAIASCTDVGQVLEFLFDHCTVAVFDGFSSAAEDVPGSVLFLVLDDGPESVAIGRVEAGSETVRLAYTTLDDFAPYEAPSRHGSNIPESREITREPRAADVTDVAAFLRMFRATADPFLFESLHSDSDRSQYLHNQARIAVFDHIRSGKYEGPLAFFLWPEGPRYVTLAVRTNRRWRFASAEVPE